MLFTDENMLFTVMRNLVANSLKFTAAAGTVSIIARPLPAASNQTEPTHVEVSVIDTGVGITAIDQEKLFQFDSHFTMPGTSQEQGAGLGLLLCKEMVERNGGSIWIRSEQGKGTIVSFTVPLAIADTAPI